MTTADPGRVLRRALLAWGLGHLLLGRRATGWALLVGEAVGLALVAWLTAGLAESSAHLVPFVAGAVFIAAWAWQAVDAFHAATRLAPPPSGVPDRSAAAHIGWLCLPLLVWGSGFWFIGTPAATPGAVLDRFVTDWSAGRVSETWPPAVSRPAEVAAATLGEGADRFRDVRVRLSDASEDAATAVVELIHFERRPTRLLGVFPGSELVPVADRRILTLQLTAVPVGLPGGGDIGAVIWELRAATGP